ncbi:MAG TPA: polysaccharide deacetylase family protein [Patescibacteria group bacterium]|nr:polysaccharide deacetylase family protein [Patescibacteria group bacterium]
MARKRKIDEKGSSYYYYLGIVIGLIIVVCFSLLFITKLSERKARLYFALRSQPTLITFNNPRNFNIPILLYHYIEIVQDQNDTIRKSLNILPYTFENQVSTLKNAGYTFLTPADINSILENHMSIPKKPVILSFDDGYGDFYTDVLPILKKYKVRAVEYVISGFLDHPNYMTRDQVREVIDSKLVEIGCHTVDHPALKTVSAEDATREIEGCEEDINRDFGFRPVSFAYPYGSYADFLFPILAKAGLKNAVTTDSGTEIASTSLYAIPRIRPGERVGIELLTYLTSEIAHIQKDLSIVVR